ncbi:MAG: hypothetical protein HY907_05900 [Deltaproteobacteria bacterium]|nr:hypothetical protein [Deltaproteobacteria bacterium]
MGASDPVRRFGSAVAALALAAVLGVALHEAIHLSLQPTHSDTQCIVCQAAHGAAVVAAAAVPSIEPAPVQRVQLATSTPPVRPRLHAGHPRGPPV